MTELHGFRPAEHAAWTLTMRDREHPGRVLDQPAAMGRVTLYDGDDARTQITEQARWPTTT